MKFFLDTFGLPSGAQSGHDLACGFKTLEAYTDKCCGFGSIRIWMNTSDPDLNMNTDQWFKKKNIMFCLVKPNSWIRICIEKSWIWINNRPMLIAESIGKKLWVTHHKKNNVFYVTSGRILHVNVLCTARDGHGPRSIHELRRALLVHRWEGCNSFVDSFNAVFRIRNRFLRIWIQIQVQPFSSPCLIF